MRKPKPLKKLTRKWLLAFADQIYNPKTKKFLKLCTGVLTNGPDPEDKKRTMHCGLGELYFAMTGKDPCNSSEYRVAFVARSLAGEDPYSPFYHVLMSVPFENDKEGDVEGESDERRRARFKRRAKRVAAVFRKAARLLPSKAE